MRGQVLIFKQPGCRAAFGMYTLSRFKRDKLSTTAGIAHGAKASFQFNLLRYIFNQRTFCLQSTVNIAKSIRTAKYKG